MVVARVVPEEPDAGPVLGVLPELPAVCAAAAVSPKPVSRSAVIRVGVDMVENSFPQRLKVQRALLGGVPAR